ncbi:MAG: hypothetical protein CfP315_0703 [Candidatus Improbicoccus pseudotrichonymphae]|uniref:Uncharacterized protein n=1 Tax=Candidatus Improbicoccus pseudotrichonymphae TaxID=3033792 RepID=A0AA48I1M3_9FIRM|nr:MAG: hypothetical protein CfP315_0703 [Candidatus Improbicoccus pseudotrichonymphae]
MKKESNGIGENKNSKKISKNNKIISSILAVVMCCQSLVGANPNSDNREFVSDKGIDNSPTADGSEKEEEDIKSKENNNSGLIRNSLDALLVAAMGSWWFYVTKNKDLKSKNEENERLNERLKKNNEEYEKLRKEFEKNREEFEKNNEENKRLKEKLEEIYKPDTVGDAEVQEKEYFGVECIAFNVGKRVEGYRGRVFFRNLTDLADVAKGVYFVDDDNNSETYRCNLVNIRVKLNSSKVLSYENDDYKQLSKYSKYILSIFSKGFDDLFSKLGISSGLELKECLYDILVEDEDKVKSNFRFTNIYIRFLDEEKKINLRLLLPQELLDKEFILEEEEEEVHEKEEEE